MAMSSANYAIHFANLGKLVKLFNQVETDRAGIVTTVEEAIAILKDSEAEVELLAAVLATRENINAGMENNKAQFKRNAEDYITGTLAKAIGFTGSSFSLADVLADLAEDMTEAEESIDGSAVAATTPTYDPDNAGTCALATPSGLTQLLTDEFWELECTSVAGGAGAETWQVRGQPHLHGVLSGALTTGEQYAGADSNGQTLFSLLLSAYTAGAGTKLIGDAGGVISAYSFTGAAKGTNTSQAGDVYPSVVDEGGGDWRVDVYSDAARTVKVAHTATFTSTGAQVLIADGGSGLTGSVTVASLAAMSDAVVRVGFAVAVGDKVYFTTTNDEAGTFSEFFRRLGVALPVDLAGGETIADALAE
jgi:hypothetical protein